MGFLAKFNPFSNKPTHVITFSFTPNMEGVERNAIKAKAKQCFDGVIDAHAYGEEYAGAYITSHAGRSRCVCDADRPSALIFQNGICLKRTIPVDSISSIVANEVVQKLEADKIMGAVQVTCEPYKQFVQRMSDSTRQM